MTALFCQLPIGARFEFRGRRYEKLGLSMAGGEDGWGNAFLDETEVAPAEGVQVLPLERDPRTGRPWYEYVNPAPPPPDYGPELSS